MTVLLENIITTEDALKHKLDLHSLLVFNLTMAVEPSYAFLTRLGGLLKRKYGARTVVEVIVDPAIVGGAVICFRGHYADLSLKKKLADYFSINKEKILNIFNE